MDSKQYIIELGKKYQFNSKEDVFQVHGKWIVTKTGIQKIQEQEQFTYEFDHIVLSADYCAMRCTVGNKEGKILSQTFASAEKSNVKNNQKYYAEMAEKRSKARGVLMAINAHGKVYSEDEADEFKAPN